jgi:acetyl esterase
VTAGAWSLHPQVQALVDAQETAPDEPGPPALEAMRDGYLQTALERGGAVEPVDSADDVVIPRPDGGRVRARLYTPLHGVRQKGSLVWLHGGGWCLGDLEGFDRVCRSLANAGGFEVVSVDYRLAPEHPFPAAIEDADAAVRWAAGRGAVVVGGDSAGGNLAAVAVRHERARVRGQVLVYPATDASMVGESYRGGDLPMLKASEMQACWTAYRGEAPAGDPDLSPVQADDLAGLPSTLIVVAGVDVLRSDGEAYAAALEVAGVEVTLELYEDMTHGFLRWGGVVDRARELVDRCAAFAAGRLATDRRAGAFVRGGKGPPSPRSNP